MRPVFRNFIVLFLFLFVLFPAHAVHAQMLTTEVKIDLQKLPQENQNKLHGLDRIIENYINSTEWGPNEYEYDVVLDIEIHFESVKALSYEDRYNAAIIVSNRSNMQYPDRRWTFPLEPGVQLQYAEQFDAFRSCLDFYIQMALGYEFDKVKKFGGTPYFETAKRIAGQARFSSRYFNGWDKREEEVIDYLEPENEQMRYLNFLYYTGEWLYYDEKDRETAKQYLLYAIKQIEKIQNADAIKRFFDLNYHNYGTTLAEYGDFTTLARLAALDPNEAHTEFFSDLMDRR